MKMRVRVRVRLTMTMTMIRVQVYSPASRYFFFQSTFILSAKM